MKGIFITGTDTNIGKTVVSSIVCRYLLQNGVEFLYGKPIQTGTDDDCKTVASLAGLLPSQIEMPIYQFPEATSPNRAAERNGATIDLLRIVNHFRKRSENFYVLEGAGGVMVPLNSTQTISDLIAELKLPTVVVSSTRLGTINHTLLTLNALKAKQINLLGVVLVGDHDPGLAQVIEQHSEAKILFEVANFTDLGPSCIQKFCSEVTIEPILRLAGNHA